MLEELDLHLVPILIAGWIIGFLVPWEYVWGAAAFVFLVPQGRVLTRAFGDLRRTQKPWKAYLLVNELFAALVAASLLMINRA